MKGQFLIINTGVGERDNITLKAYAAMQRADLIIASRKQRQRFADVLVDTRVIDGGHGLFTALARRRLSAAAVAQQETIMRETVEMAYAEGKVIALLDSGDTALFSPYRGYLRAFAHLQPQLIAGLSSVNAANALLAQPVLDDQRQHLRLSGLEAILTCADASTLPDTWVLFCMGLDWPRLVRKIQALYPPETRTAIITRAGYNDAIVRRMRVGEWRDDAADDYAFPYCIIYVGLP